MERYDEEVERALIFGQDPAERIADLTRQPIKEGSRLVNDLALIQEARVRYIQEYVTGVLIVADGDQSVADELVYSQYVSYRKLLPHVSPYDWEAAFGKSTAKMELRLALEQYSDECAATGKVFHHLGRRCD